VRMRRLNACARSQVAVPMGPARAAGGSGDAAVWLLLRAGVLRDRSRDPLDGALAHEPRLSGRDRVIVSWACAIAGAGVIIDMS